MVDLARFGFIGSACQAVLGEVGFIKFIWVNLVWFHWIDLIYLSCFIFLFYVVFLCESVFISLIDLICKVIFILWLNSAISLNAYVKNPRST